MPPVFPVKSNAWFASCEFSHCTADPCPVACTDSPVAAKFQMPNFDKTYTDAEFKREILLADNQWMSQHARREPDLDVDGLKPDFLSRVLGLFGVGGR